jgi:hypothetical protein
MPSTIPEVRAEADEVRAALLNPAEAGDFAAELLRLNAAIDRLRQVKVQMEGAPPVADERAELERDLLALKEELARLANLAGHGEAFWRGWGRLLGLDTGGYTEMGLPESINAGKSPSITKVVA